MNECYQYEFRVESHMGANLASWFEGLTIQRETGGLTALYGPIPDQAALHNLLARFCDLGLSLVSMQRLEKTRQSDNKKQQPLPQNKILES